MGLLVDNFVLLSTVSLAYKLGISVKNENLNVFLCPDKTLPYVN